LNKPRLLDAFCKAGGAGMGYSQAGFEVVGIDIEPQKNYPFEFIQGNALTYIIEHGYEFDAIHASPPCQKHSAMTKGRWQDRLRNHLNLIPATREVLKLTGKPYVIENVAGAKAELIDPVMLCGTMFNLQTKHGSQLRRHRLFECSFDVWNVPLCNHLKGSVIGVYGGGQHPGRRCYRNDKGKLVIPEKRIPATIGVWGNAGGSSKRDGIAQFGTQDRRDAMGIQWMSGKELSQAIPPAYTEFIGEQIFRAINETENKKGSA